MSFAWETRVPIPARAISLHELSLLVAERARFEALGVPRLRAIEVARQPRRARPHSYAGRRRRTIPTGPRMDKDAA